MRETKIENSWRSYFQDRGLPEEVTETYISYIRNLSYKNLPIIFELEHLSQLIGIKTDELTKMINAPYRFIEISKYQREKAAIEKSARHTHL